MKLKSVLPGVLAGLLCMSWCGVASASESVAGGNYGLAASSSAVETLPEWQVNEIISRLRQDLPQDMGDGIIWTGIGLTDNNQYLQITLKLLPSAFEGVSAEDLYDAFRLMSQAELQTYLGNEFIEVGEMLGKRVSLKILIPGQNPLVLKIN